MSSEKTTSQSWTSVQAYVLAAFCLGLGITLGYLFRGSAAPAAAAAPSAGERAAGAADSQAQALQQREVVSRAAAPLLASLKDRPDDFDTLVKVANLYYDGQQYPDAIEYYERAVKIQPQNADVLTDFGTSYWYVGEADKAITQFQAALRYQPGRASTLFNLGIVRWQGKNDPKGAVRAWEELLQKNPDYPDKAKLQEYIDRAKQHAKG